MSSNVWHLHPRKKKVHAKLFGQDDGAFVLGILVDVNKERKTIKLYCTVILKTSKNIERKSSPLLKELCSRETEIPRKKKIKNDINRCDDRV